MKNISTDQDVIVSNSTDIPLNDSIAKLSIMTEATVNPSDAVPQIMLSQTTSGETKSWYGDYLTFNYNKADNTYNGTHYFSISENTKNSTTPKLSYEFLGSNNIYHTIPKNTNSNAFILSESNKLADYTTECTFIHSDGNMFELSANKNMTFIGSNDNEIQKAGSYGRFAKANNFSLYNSNDNVIQPFPTTISNNAKDDCSLDNQVLFGSNYNYIKGDSRSENAVNPNTVTMINCNSGLYDYNEDHGSMVFIGNKYNFISGTNSANVIGIGVGLIQYGDCGDKIILGQYNANSTDPNEVLIVGDGQMSQEYLDDIASANWTKNKNTQRKFIEQISGNGGLEDDYDYYRHNIFTVNKEGYITISDYNTNNSARYGFSGITAYVESTSEPNTVIEKNISYEALANAINNNRNTQEKLDSYTDTLKKCIDDAPKNGTISLTDNTITTIYLNCTGTAQHSIDYEDVFEATSAVNRVYTIYNQTNNTVDLIWESKISGDYLKRYKTTLNSRNTKEFIFISSGLSGLSYMSHNNLPDYTEINP